MFVHAIQLLTIDKPSQKIARCCLSQFDSRKSKINFADGELILKISKKSVIKGLNSKHNSTKIFNLVQAKL